VQNEIRIRPAVPNDAEAIANVMITAMRSAFEGIVPDRCLQWPDSAADWKQAITADFGTGIFLDVAQISGGLIVAYAMGSRITDDPLYPGELLQLNVLPGYQRQGIGALLVLHVARRLAEQNIHSLRVKVMRVNPYRIFYERLGAHYLSEHPYDWDGVMLPECIYGWKDSNVLLSNSGRL
jgi:ribosomal protein S18 acetylase RimI-like enzyme